MAAAKSGLPTIDKDKLEQQVLANLPDEIVHHVKVRLIFDFVAVHPVTGKEVPIAPELLTIAKS